MPVSDASHLLHTLATENSHRINAYTKADIHPFPIQDPLSYSFVCGEKLCLIYFDSSIDILSVDELLWLYNDAVEDIGYYQMKSHELQSEVDALWQSYEELEDELYG